MVVQNKKQHCFEFIERENETLKEQIKLEDSPTKNQNHLNKNAKKIHPENLKIVQKNPQMST